MRRILAIVLLIAISAPFLVKSGLIFHFKLNQNTIIANHCENKAKPKLECNGKCYLKKQLSELEPSNEIPKSIQRILELEIPFFVAPNQNGTFSMLDIVKERTYLENLIYSVPCFEIQKGVFHPPQLV